MNNYLIVFGYFFSILLINYVINNYSKKNLDPSLSALGFIATIVPTWYGGVLAAAEYYYKLGWIGWLTYAAPYHVYLFVMIFLVHFIRRQSALTIPQLFSYEFGPLTSKIAGFLSIIHTSPATYIMMSTIALGHIININFHYALLIITAYIILSVIIKGFNGIKISNYIDFVIMYAGIILLFIYGLKTNEHKIFDIMSHSQPGVINWVKIITCFLIASSTLVDPNFYHRIKLCNSNKSARLGMIGSLILFLLFDFILVCYSKIIQLSGITPNSSMDIIYLISNKIPVIAYNIINIAILSISLSTALSYSFASQLMLQEYISKFKYKEYYALIIIMAFNVLLCLLHSSIISIWYNLGNIALPGLIILMVSYYFKIKLSDRQAQYILYTALISSTSYMILNNLFNIGSLSPLLVGLSSGLGCMFWIKKLQN